MSRNICVAENPTNSAKKMASEVPLSSAKIPMLATRLPNTMPGASRFTMSQRTAPRLWWAYTLESDVNMIVAIDVAIAILTVRSDATPCLPRMKVIRIQNLLLAGGRFPSQQTPWNRLRRATGVAPCKGEGVAERSPRSLGVYQIRGVCSTTGPAS